MLEYGTGHLRYGREAFASGVGASLERQAHGERVVDIVMRAAVLIWGCRCKATQRLRCASGDRGAQVARCTPFISVAESPQYARASPGTSYMMTLAWRRKLTRFRGGPGDELRDPSECFGPRVHEQLRHAPLQYACL